MRSSTSPRSPTIRWARRSRTSPTTSTIARASNLARKAKSQGVKAFVFASSCSMYGLADDTPRKETSPLNPLTAYAKSKVRTEARSAATCGSALQGHLPPIRHRMRHERATAPRSRRQRLSSRAPYLPGIITILSDGTPWRPLIHVKDMARAIDWAIGRDREQGGDFLAVNAGSNVWNYQVKQLAEAVAKVIPGVSISINKNAPPDNRSYRVDFALYESSLRGTSRRSTCLRRSASFRDGLGTMGFKDPNFRASKLHATPGPEATWRERTGGQESRMDCQPERSQP